MTFSPRTLAGNWWLPGAPESAVSGELTYDDEGLRLTLRGSFVPPLEMLQEMGRRSAGVETLPLVLGETTTRERVTLHESLVVATQMQLFGPGVPTLRLVPRFAYVGVHVDSPDDLTWTRARFRLRHLTEWYGAEGVSDRPIYDEKRRQIGYALEYRKPPPLKASVNDVLVELIPEFSLAGQSLRGRTLDPRVTWSVEFPQEVSIQTVVERFASPLQDMVTLGTGVPCLITDLRLYHTEYADTGTGHQFDVEVLYDSHRVGAEVDNVLTQHEMLFTANVLSGHFGRAIAAWLAAWQELRSVCGLIFGPGYVGQDVFDNRILNTVSAAEALHRARFDSNEVSVDEHEARINAVLQSAPDAHRPWLKRKLKYSNEVDLGRRLRELYVRAAGVASGLAPNRETFIQHLVDARNDLAHRGALPDYIDRAPLHHAVEALKYILKACLIQETGLRAAETVSLFENNAQYQEHIQFGQGL